MEPRAWEKSFGGLSSSGNSRYRVQSSTSAYMLMYRRKDPTLNIDSVPNDVVPRYLFTDAEEEERKAKEERERKLAEQKKAEEERKLRESQIPLAVWYGERCVRVLPKRHDEWGTVKAMIFEQFEVRNSD